MKTKNEIYVVLDTPKKAKKLQKVLDMFGEKPNEQAKENDNVWRNTYFYFENKGTYDTAIYEKGCHTKGKTKVSIKELLNILAVEHLKEGDVVVLGIGSTEYVVKYKKFDGNYFESIDYYMIGGSGKTRGSGAFDNFIRYVTEEERSLLEPKEEKKELEVGKWYKYPEYPKFLSIHTNNGNRYGFDINGLWFNSDDSLLGCSGYVEATTEEVKQALIKEAEKRGFVKGSIFKGVEGAEKNIKIPIKEIKYDSVDGWGLYSGNSWILFQGKWAEVLPQTSQKTEITDQDIATLERLHDTLHDVHGYSLEFELMKSARVLAEKLRDLQKPQFTISGAGLVNYLNNNKPNLER